MTQRKDFDGVPIVDGKKRLVVRVIPADITKASKKKSDKCAVAQACLRDLQVPEARIHLTRIYLLDKDRKTWRRYQTPMAMREQIISFDQGGSFESRDFIISPPYTKSGERQGGRKPDSIYRKGTHKRAKPHFLENVRAHA